MEIVNRSYSVLIVSSSREAGESVRALIPQNRCCPVKITGDGASARRLLLEGTFDIVIINTPLKDGFGTRLALDISDSGSTCVMLLVKAEHYAEINTRISPYGVLTVSKPTIRQIMSSAVDLLCGTRERLRRMEQKTASVEEKMEEIRIVNKAKWLLIDQLKMTEQQAHRYIEKQAMDRCVTKRAVAENILSTYK